MIKSRLAAAAILTALVAHTQTIHPARSPYDRRGLYHATIHGCVVSPTGEPVPGVHLQLLAGRPGSLPLVDAVTAADGRFTMSDVNSLQAPSIIWYPPDGWAQGAAPLTGESDSDIDVGDIQLEREMIIRATLELPGGAPVPEGNLPHMVKLRASILDGPTLEAERVGDGYVLRGVPSRGSWWEVTLYSRSDIERYTGPFRLEAGKSDQHFKLRLLRDPAIRNWPNAGKVEASEAPASTQPLSREFKVTGRVVGRDASPVEGAIVYNSAPTEWITSKQQMRQWTSTRADGTFTLNYRAPNCARPNIAYGASTEWNLFDSKPNMRDIPCEEWLKTPQTIVMPYPSRLPIRITGVDPSKVHAEWWHGSLGWQQLPSLRPWFSARTHWSARIKVTADGYLPLASPIKFPRFNFKDEPPPELPPLDFRFDSSVHRTLTVVTNGKPIAGATVDIESIEDLWSDRRIVLGTYTVPADGQLRLLGGRDQLVEVFVYAKGFEPRRAIWNPGSPLVVDLVARTSTLEFPSTSSAVAAFIRQAESPSDLRIVRLHPGKSVRTLLTPGNYDITCHTPTGSVTGYRRIAVPSGGLTEFDCAADHRPRLTVVLPSADWRLFVSRSKPPGGVAQWSELVHSPRKVDTADESITFTSESTKNPVVTVSHAGRWFVEVYTKDWKVKLWREVNLQAGESATIVVPTNTGTVKASTRTYNGGLESFIHGYATPRLQLISQDPNGWSVTDRLPKRDATEGEQRHNFTLTGIPAGNYHLYHHLIGKPETFDYGSGPMTLIEPIDAWGGIPVRVEANSTTQLRDLIDYPFAELQVRLTDAQGQPVEHATVRIRDRMSESWRQMQESPRLFEQPTHWIPYPPAARIVNGRATLPNIREGWLELLVEPDSGPIYSFTVPVSPQRELQLKLPAGR